MKYYVCVSFIFIVLKVAEGVNWPWWVILMPIYAAPVALLFVWVWAKLMWVKDLFEEG